MALILEMHGGLPSGDLGGVGLQVDIREYDVDGSDFVRKDKNGDDYYYSTVGEDSEYMLNMVNDMAAYRGVPSWPMFAVCRQVNDDYTKHVFFTRQAADKFMADRGIEEDCSVMTYSVYDNEQAMAIMTLLFRLYGHEENPEAYR